VLKDGDDKERSSFKINAFYGIGVAVVLEEGEETFAYVFDILRVNIFEDINMDEILKEIGKEPMIPEDEFETVICRVMNGHEYLRVFYYCTEMQIAFIFTII